MAEISETYKQYALGLARKKRLPSDGSPADKNRELKQRLMAAGAGGWPDRNTFFTRSVPRGCGSCLKGMGSNICLTTHCNKNCFFCFNPKPRMDEISVHGRKVSGESEAVTMLRELGIRSIGLSGGEPLLYPERTLNWIKKLRAESPKTWIDLYTNGDLLTPEIAVRLREAGLSGMRINLAARNYDPEPAGTARKEFSEVVVEIPAIPGHLDKLQGLVTELDRMGVPHLVLHELFVSEQNLETIGKMGFRAKGNEKPENLIWSPLADSEGTALELMLYSMDHTKQISVYYCSCGTQQWIAEKALQLEKKAKSSPTAA